jgi:hypothetical protein
MEMIKTNPHYWDCDCDVDYIHPKSQRKCKKCGAISSEQPDSRENEVKCYFKP